MMLRLKKGIRTRAQAPQKATTLYGSAKMMVWVDI